eukprot:PhM_4_TR16822/c1_g1_i6/m.47797
MTTGLPQSSKKTQEGTHAVVYDSAAAPQTRRDFMKLLRGLSIDSEVVQHARQPRDSMECGLHVCMIALIIAHSQKPPLPSFIQSTTVLSLDSWRRELSRLGLQAMSLAALLRCVPQAQHLVPTTFDIESSTAITEPSTQQPVSTTPTSTTSINLDSTSVATNDHDLDLSNVPLEYSDIRNVLGPDDIPLVDLWFSETEQLRRDTLGSAPRTTPLPSIAVQCRNLPHCLTHLRSKLLTIAQKKHTTDLHNTLAAPWNCWKPAESITIQVIDTIARFVTTQANNCVVIECSKFELPRFGHILPQSTEGILMRPVHNNDNVAVIAHRSGHYILLTFDRESENISVLDSLLGENVPSILVPEDVALVNRFTSFLGALELAPSRIAYQPCPLQGTNDCGIESTRNLFQFAGLHCTDRNLSFNRQTLHDTWQSIANGVPPDAALSSHLNLSTTPPSRYRNDPYNNSGRVLLPPNATARDSNSYTSPKPYTHQDVRSFLEHCGQATIRFDVEDEARQRRRVLGVRNDKHSLKILAQFCDTCDEWHEASAVEKHPEPGARYTNIAVEKTPPHITLDCGNGEDASDAEAHIPESERHELRVARDLDLETIAAPPQASPSCIRADVVRR